MKKRGRVDKRIGPRKSLNNNFFNSDSRERSYVLGAFHSCFYVSENRGAVIRSRYRELVETLGRVLGSGYSIVGDKREDKSSYFMQFRITPKLYSKLDKLGLSREKDKRPFPEDIKEGWMSHFVRGFIDARSFIHKSESGLGYYPVLHIRFINDRFLSGLHEVLKREAKIKKGNFKDGKLYCGREDTKRIRDFIYQDWKFVEESGLFLPEKREKLYDENYNGKKPPKNEIEAKKRFNRAKRLLLRGKRPVEVTEILGYASLHSFSNCFRDHVGLSPTNFVKAKKRKSKRYK